MNLGAVKQGFTVLIAGDFSGCVKFHYFGRKCKWKYSVIDISMILIKFLTLIICNLTYVNKSSENAKIYTSWK
jgi:hypothetical protein